MAPTFERVTAADLRPGDQFASARSHPLSTVRRVLSIGASSRWIELDDTPTSVGGRIRPRHTTKFWRVVR